MTMKHTFAIITAAAFALGAFTSPVDAQNKLGDGRRLDNNLRQGSGGINSRQPDQRLQYGAYQDAIVTGNVTGLARFRGNISYRAPGEFRGNLGSNDTYNFQLQSRPTVPINPYQARQLGIPDGSLGSDNRVITQRAGAGVTTGDVSRPVGQSSNLLRTDASTLLTSTNASTRTLDSTLLNVNRPVVGLTADARGNLSRVEASPLVGLRVVPATPRYTTRAIADADAETDPDDEPTTPRIDGEPITDRPGGEPDEPTDPRINDRVEPAIARTGATDTADLIQNWKDAKPGEDVYMDLLRKSGQLSNAAPPDVEKDPAEPATGPAAPRTRVQDILEQFEKRDEDSEEAKREAAEKKLIADLVATIDKGAAPIQTLVGEGDTAYDKSMAEAERLMGEGKYFKAEAEYVRAMRMKPGQPMAMVGRIHAQVGAGLFLSAGTNLRMMFSVFPEMIATRYGGDLLPVGERRDKVRKALAATLKGEARAEVHLLAAYLAFQEGDAELVHEALRSAEARAKDDRLIKIARVIWTRPQIDKKPDKEAAPAEK